MGVQPVTEELLFRLLASGVFPSFAENKYSRPVIDRASERSNDFGMYFENTKQEELVTIRMNRLRSIITEIPLRLLENDESLRIALGGDLLLVAGRFEHSLLLEYWVRKELRHRLLLSFGMDSGKSH